MSVEEDVIGCGDDTSLLIEVYLIGAEEEKMGGKLRKKVGFLSDLDDPARSIH
jgi:hypothetical protein